MTGNEDGTMTPKKVKDLATVHAKLPRLALIGVFGSVTHPAALIRSANGTFSRITVGDKAAGGVVAAIGQAEVVIAKRGQTSILRMPAG